MMKKKNKIVKGDPAIDIHTKKLVEDFTRQFTGNSKKVLKNCDLKTLKFTRKKLHAVIGDVDDFIFTRIQQK